MSAAKTVAEPQTLTRCLFPVAGYGTRFLPVTKSMPKEMLPIVNKPLVQYGVEEALAAGMDEIGFVTGRGKRAIADYFDVSYELEQEIQGTAKEQLLAGVRDIMRQGRFLFTRQARMGGLGHAVLVGEILMGQEAFGVILADDLCFNPIGVMEQLRAVYLRYGCSVVAVEELPAEQISSFGVVAGPRMEEDENLLRVEQIVEKPRAEEAPSNLAIIGRYILTPDIFDILRETPPDSGGEVQLTDALAKQAAAGKLLALRFSGKRFDCGSVKGFVAATNHCYQAMLAGNDRGC